MRLNTESLKEITIKELLAVIVFVFSMSGVYYKLFYSTDTQAKAFESYVKFNDTRFDILQNNQKTQNDIFRAELEMLKDDYKARKAIEDYKQSEFKPLKRQ